MENTPPQKLPRRWPGLSWRRLRLRWPFLVWVAAIVAAAYLHRHGSDAGPMSEVREGGGAPGERTVVVGEVPTRPDPPHGGDALRHAQDAAVVSLSNGGDAGSTSDATEAGSAPTEETVVISEVLTHSDPPLEDAIELHNPTERDVDVGGYCLTDNKEPRSGFRIPDGTVIPAGGYVVFYENRFGRSGGSWAGFALSSARGEELFLFSRASGDHPPTCVDSAALGPAANGVSLGRYVASGERVRFVAMSRRTFGADNPRTLVEFRAGKGAPNAPPKVGPVVISEIMYNPAGTGEEFIELHNRSDGDVDLYDPSRPTNIWRFDNGIEYSFPAGAMIRSGGYCLVVGVAPRVFRRWYRVPRQVPVYGPWTGNLKNGGESIELVMPDQPQGVGHLDEGFVPYILVERVRYDDKDPWPESAGGRGPSLERVNASGFGDDPANWHAGGRGGTPGKPNSPPPAESADGAGSGAQPVE